MPKTTIKHPNRHLQHALPGVLREPGLVGASKQTTRSRNAGQYRAVYWEPWPGQSVGIRAPEDDETPLSEIEVCFAVERELI